ncbi:MAG: hypothetical protein R2838_01355 [Caldilineaceae bacterium]
MGGYGPGEVSPGGDPPGHDGDGRGVQRLPVVGVVGESLTPARGRGR